MKTRYMNKDMGDGTHLGLITVKHPVLDIKLPALEFRFDGKKMMCFLADSEGNSFVLELFEALGEYIADVEDTKLEAMEDAEKHFAAKLLVEGLLTKQEAAV